ncbi:MAG TPA: CHAD domain-containing protein [Actinomycetota bacterium]|nr:CHAD domain-containing protein [Actinomycetota bacterium]
MTDHDAMALALAEQVELELDHLTRLADEATALDVIRSAIAGSTIKLVSNDPVIRLGEDPEGVHKARVAARRLRSDLRTFRPLLDREWAGALRAELRWLGRLLGPVRDAEVLGARLRGRVAGMVSLEVASAKVLLDGLENDRLAGRRRLLEALRSRRYEELVVRLVRAAREPVARSERVERPAVTTGILMKRPWAKLSGSATALGAGSSDAALHATRIDTKRVRYGAEALVTVFGKRATRFASAAEALQEVFGEHQDAVVAMAWLADRGMEADDQAVAFTAGRLAELETTSRDRARAAWPEAWRRLERRKRFWTC